MKENNTIKDYIKNNELDLERIIQDYSAYVSKIINNMAKGFIKEIDKEEIVSDVFFALWKNKRNLDVGKSLSPYLAGITRNVVKVYFAKNKIKYENIDDYENDLNFSDDFCFANENYDKIKSIEKKVGSMKKIDKGIFLDFYYYSKSIKDIAKKYNISEDSAKQRLYRIRKRIKKEIQKNG